MSSTVKQTHGARPEMGLPSNVPRGEVIQREPLSQLTVTTPSMTSSAYSGGISAAIAQHAELAGAVHGDLTLAGGIRRRKQLDDAAMNEAWLAHAGG